MKYICDEIIFITEYEKSYTYFKIRVVGGIFCAQYYWYTSIESKANLEVKNIQLKID
jgi:hypothetical protein